MIRRLLGARIPTAPARCRTCRHFDADPAAIEAAFPGLGAMSSGYGSVRARDGICRLRSIYLSGGAGCEEHAPAN